MAVPVEERSVQFLLKDEFFHQFGLLHPSRSIQPHEVPDSPAEESDAPASAKEPSPKELTVETSLVKCSTLTDIAGSSSKLALAPVIEEEENLHILEKTAEVEVENDNSPMHHGDDTFDSLSDIMITSQELFKDDASKAISSVIEATSSLQQTTTPSIQAVTIPTQKSGL